MITQALNPGFQHLNINRSAISFNNFKLDTTVLLWWMGRCEIFKTSILVQLLINRLLSPSYPCFSPRLVLLQFSAINCPIKCSRKTFQSPKHIHGFPRLQTLTNEHCLYLNHRHFHGNGKVCNGDH